MMKDLYLAAGCFWGAEHYLKRIRGVVKTEAGYANGNISHPTCLVQIYFIAIDPTSVNKQGEDEGTRYRTGIYYSDPADLPSIMKIYDRVAGEIKAPLAVEVKPLKNFYRAEDSHQDYLDKHPQGYCHISPALMEFARTANEPASDTD